MYSGLAVRIMKEFHVPLSKEVSRILKYVEMKWETVCDLLLAAITITKRETDLHVANLAEWWIGMTSTWVH
jgi:hypothetical protein